VVAGHLLEGAGQVLARIVAVAAEPVAVGLDHPAGGIQQPLAGRVLAGPAQQGAHGLLGLFPGDLGGGDAGSHGDAAEATGDGHRTRPGHPEASTFAGRGRSSRGRHAFVRPIAGAGGPSGSHMPPAGPIARLRELMSVSPADPALLKAQYRAFAGQLPLMYLVVAANTWLLAWTHVGHAPAWLTVGVPALLTGGCLARCVQWWRGRREEPDASAAHRALVRAGRMAWPVALAFSLWPLLLFPYGDAFLRSHVAFCMATTAAVSQLYLMHVRPAMLTIALVFNGGFILFFAATGEPTFVAMAVSVALMTFVLVTTLLRQYRRFTDLVGSRLRAERLGAENLRLANLDSLTRLPNRRAFFGALVQACERADARGTRLAVGIIDLDGFKPINDLYGHAAGDRLLKQVGQRLSLMASGRIHLARLGGDEFAMIAEDLGGDEAYVAFARSLCEQLRAPFQLEDLSLQVTATIGLVLYPDLACHAEDLYERADYALYHGKRLRR